ncbi:MAG TPA: XrtA system polysaccharide deacetylase [Anaerolineae bacterium]|nr:XrtA system polysaccharide deacetylase [Anaerolineae bacterium]
MSSILNALTIDVEEHFQVHAFETVVDRSAWDRYPSRVVANTQRILRLLAEYDVQATFFVLGWVADRYPDLVKEIAMRGHEVATHGYWHELIYRQTPAEFAADLRQSLEAIGRAFTGLQPAGYRAPAFSITKQSLWALDVLRDHGLIYDSSIFPLTAHDRYGINNASRFANKTDNGLWEFPVSTIRLGKQNWPVAGGGYFRLFPLWITRQAMRHLNGEGQPAVIYLHPWEFDPDQPRIPDAPLLSRFRHYVNIGQTESRLRALLNEFAFAPMCEVFASCLEAV